MSLELYNAQLGSTVQSLTGPNPQSKNCERYRRTKLRRIADEVIRCKACSRLVEYRQKVAHQRKREFKDWTYWGRPVPSFGDPRAEFVIIGLAPAAHGANRTGRMFTGDSSGNFLMRALYEAGLANKPRSERADDGLQLNNTYLTATVRCAPPKNKPTRLELDTCKRFLHLELDSLRNGKVVLALGKVAFEAYKQYLREKGMNVEGLTFVHGACYNVAPHFPYFLASYHPSRQNTQTRRLTAEMLSMVVREMKKKAKNNHLKHRNPYF